MSTALDHLGSDGPPPNGGTGRPRSGGPSVRWYTRLYRGETTFPFIQRRRRWYLLSGIVLLICAASLVFRGFNLGIEFKGGTQFTVQASGTSLVTDDITRAFGKAGVDVTSPAQEVGSGANRKFILKAPETQLADQTRIKTTAAKDLGVPEASINTDSVSSSWGADVTRKSLQGLVVFLIAVSIYIAIRFEPRMAVAAIIALLHDLLLTAGVYSIIGFEVTPSTVVGLLTILGFSLYDTVVIFDKVAENTKDLTAGSRMTYTEAANLAVNQTLMRSINTSLISLLPVAGLLFIGAGVLGVGTIKDLALVMFVGIATGAYSSLFLAAPIVVDLTERLPAFKALTSRVAAKRSSVGARERVGASALAGSPPVRRAGGPAPAPRPGARPARADGTRASAAATRPDGPAGPGAGKPSANRPKPPPRRKK
ncbi:MAG: protein translocase subunit SecF [bacterium]